MTLCELLDQTKANPTPGMFCCMRKKNSLSVGFSVTYNQNNPEGCKIT